jgi:hypothetical protein
MKLRDGFALPLLLAALGTCVQGADTPEPGTREAIAAATTEARFLSPWVSDLPDSKTVPSPTKFLGHIAGAPGELTRTEKVYGYFRALAAASPRVKVETIGKSEEGREFILVIIGDEASVRDLEGARAAMAALADPRRTDEAAMEKIVAAQKPFYMFHGGLHSSETGSPEMLMELAYRLAVSEAPLIRDIRAHVTVLINPVAEPDGRDRMVDWFYKNLKGKTDYDQLPPISPPYWGHYVFHDNNRDGMQRMLATTRATQDAFLKWHPVVVHDLHESIPLLSIWTGTGPYDPAIDPNVANEKHALAFHEVSTLTAFGMPGVWTWGFGEGFAEVFADSVAVHHNALNTGFETFGNGTAETVTRRIDPEREKYTGKPVTETDWYRTVPPPAKNFKWSLRDNTNYMESGVLAALQYAARNGPDMLRNFWRRGHEAVRKGETEKPYAVALPEKQNDPGRLAALLNLLRAHGIEVGRAGESFKVKEGEFPAGTYVVKLDQPYRGYALDLLTAQKYPAESSPYDAYDDVGWSLPDTFGVEAKLIEDAAVRKVATQPVMEPVELKGKLTLSGAAFLIRDSGQEALLRARVRLAAFRVEAAEKSFSAGGMDFPAGSWVIPAQPGVREALEKTAPELGLAVTAVSTVPAVPRHPLDLPRLGVLQIWDDTQSAGWVRMLFDEEKIPYTLIMDGDVRAGGLRQRFDVILFPNTDDSLKDIIGGIDPKFSPLPYVKSAEFPTLGTPTSSPDITGGLTWRGVGNLESFVREGGVLVTLGGASALPLDGGIARDMRHAKTKNLSNPGSMLRARFRRPDHPLAYGYPENTAAFREDRTLYDVRRADRGRIVLQWGATLPKDDEKDDADDKDKPAPVPEADKGKDKEKEKDADKKPESIVISGGIKGGDELEGKPAILDIPTGKGRVIAFDFDPIHRAMTRADFRLAWNAILNWNDFPPVPPTP